MVAVLSFSAGFLLSQYGPDFKSTKDKNGQLNKKAGLPSSPLFKSQTAIVQGTIIKVDQSNLVVSDNKNQTDSFPIYSNVVIYKSDPTSPRITPATGKEKIVTNEQAAIVLELIDGKYQVISITYPPKAPSSTQSSTSSATNKNI